MYYLVSKYKFGNIAIAFENNKLNALIFSDLEDNIVKNLFSIVSENNLIISNNKDDMIWFQKIISSIENPTNVFPVSLNINGTEFQKKVWVKKCKTEIIKNETDKFWTMETAEGACECLVSKIFNEGNSYKDLKEIIDVNSPIFNEVAIPCVVKAFDKKNIGPNNYNINDIIGGGYKSEVKLIDYFGIGFKVKIKIGNVIKYFLFDTGSTDLIIDQATERELLLAGFLKRDNYLNKTTFELADNKTVIGQKIKLNNIEIGDYTVNNVVLTIINQGSLLCGKSFLDKFKNWELDKKNKVLTLYK